MTWASVALAAFVAETEAGTVIQEATPTGQYSLGAVYGVGQVFSRTIPATLAAWTQASHQFSGLWLWLTVQGGFGVLLIAGYLGLGLALRRPHREGDPSAGGALSRLAGRWRLRQWLPLYLLALVNLVQDGIAITVALAWIRPHDYVPAGVAGALEGAVIAKWVMAVVVAGWLAYRVLVSAQSAPRARQIGSALKKQRFSVVIVVLLGVMAVARGSGVLEQLPDVQRSWLTWPPSLGWAQLAFAVLAQALLAVVLVLLSAMRVQRARAARLPADRRDVHSYLPWLLTSLVVPALALVLWLTGGAAVAWRRVIAIPLVLCGVAVISVVIQFAARRRSAAGPGADGAAEGDGAGGADDTGRADGAGAADDGGGSKGGEGEAEGVRAARTAGDMLAVAVIAVTGLGLVRSFTAAALVADRPYSWAFAAAVAAGFAVTILPWLAARRPLQDLAAYFDRRYHSTGSQRTRNGISPRRTGTTDERRSPSLLLAVFAAPFVIADVLLIFLPLAATHWLGVLATMVISLGTLAAGLAVLAYLVQSRRPLPVFALLRLRATPVFTLIVIIGLVGGALDTSSRLHDIRLPAAAAAAGGNVTAPPGGAPTMAGSLGRWLADPATKSCARAVPAGPGAPAGGVRVEPLILVAAAGGGIRAAWWTVHALGALAATGCGRHAVFAASGVSGGSIGLAILGTTAARDAAVARIAGPDGLAAATDGLLLRDTIAGLAGLDLAAAGMPPGQRFPDRAALLERAWETEDPALAEPFPLRRPALPWRLMFNSTAVGTGCRAVIADRRIAPAPAPAAPAASSPSCGLSSGAPLPDGYDFFAEYPCLAGLDTATAALLSARFPYVTPSGVVNGCGRLAGTQLEQYVDGGYADSSGLATLAGLAPQLMPAIRQYNADAVASARPGRPVTLVLPVAVYLGNSPQPEPATGTAARSPSQPLIPLASGAASAQGQLTSSATLLQQLSGDISAALPPSCGRGGAACPRREQWLACATANSRCAADQAAAASAVRQQVIVVTPREFPAVTAPLGWVLSPASRLTLDRALTTEAAGRCLHPAQNQEFCPADTGRLGDLLRMINGG